MSDIALLGSRVELRVPGLDHTGMFGKVTSAGYTMCMVLKRLTVLWDDGSVSDHQEWELEAVS